MNCTKVLLCISIFCHLGLLKAQTATITGVVLDESQKPLAGVNISSRVNGSFSDINGFYALQLIPDQQATITFSHLGHKNVVVENLILTTNETYEFNPVLKIDTIQIDGVTVSPTGEKQVKGIVTITPQTIRKIPGANAGVENVLKLLPGVNSNNELSTQYSVRGGNYDENLVYVNEIEVYRPFLVRSAQQEGLSFVNSDLAQNVKFSSGGFQAKYGDKLSSVLDITYKNPSDFGVSLDVSLLGAAASVETISKNKNFSAITGIRYRNNSLLINSQDTRSNLNPTFADLQGFFTYRFSKKFNLNFLGNLSINDYQNEPISRQTNFGTLSDPRVLTVFYEGNENNRFNTALGALKGNYFVNENTTLKLIASLYHTTEEEYSDVIAQYELGELNTNLGSDQLGDISGSRGLGTEFNRARNELDALIFNIEQKGAYSKDNSMWQWGLKYTHEDIRDQIRESEFIDSVGFYIRPPSGDFPNNQPEEPFAAPIVAYDGVSATNFVKTNRFTAFSQYSNQMKVNTADLYYNVGLRAQHWAVIGVGFEKTAQTIVSPRLQLALKPDWKRDMLFRVSGGVYQQPPFYRELRDRQGVIQPDVEAQKSIHVVIGNEYSFTWADRPFNFTSEIYYKALTNVNPYTLEDVRIRYAANNNATAYVYGAEIRLNGAFVPGTESWLSLGYLKTEENIDQRGYISRPTDQRLKVGILFQDYVPNIPKLKMYLNLVYNTGVPGGSPNYADPYVFQNRLRDYRRADLGISYIFVDSNNPYPKNHWLHRFRTLSGGFEIFNVFNTQNSITNTWVRDVDSKQQFAVPNFLTSRIFNLRLSMRF
ncbi:TonB-dependent receptor [Aggregatimonas sangjinii]|uniref:TonB-dependent receptor n=1 Tax=Aggregatimonas sangjinii TaxID=2583587 RepID=A0A5B7SUI2_9FLAO|nr:carboxypeptidase-like regulatory domain-containing protein [Aggregatimonas sangjinii]QCX00541.1 TonB-dependent receptor [Aggregatimonas sangjinii]